MPVPRKYNDEFVARARILANEGKSIRETAGVLDVSYAHMKYAAAQYGIRFAGLRRPPEVKPALEEDIGATVGRDRRIRQLEDELSTTKRKYEIALREDTLGERLVDATLSAIRAMPAVEPIAELPGNPTHGNTQDVVGLMSCLHFGEVVSPDATMGLGVYNPELAAARYEYYIDRMLDLAFRHHSGETFDTMWLVDVGDNFSGGIHAELKETNAYPVGEQIVRVANLLALGVRDLAKFFKRVVFIGTVGNHSRFSDKPTFKDKVTNNGDYVVYHMMKALLADQKNVELIIPESPYTAINIRGQEFFFTHGDSIKMYYKFPYYDTRSFVTEMAQMLVAGNRPYPKYWGFGHFHQANVSQLSYGEWLFTGSFKGPDEYSINKIRAGTPPTQLFFGVHPINGVTFPYPVLLDRADPKIQSRYLKVL